MTYVPPRRKAEFLGYSPSEIGFIFTVATRLPSIHIGCPGVSGRSRSRTLKSSLGESIRRHKVLTRHSGRSLDNVCPSPICTPSNGWSAHENSGHDTAWPVMMSKVTSSRDSILRIRRSSAVRSESAIPPTQEDLETKIKCDMPDGNSCSESTHHTASSVRASASSSRSSLCDGGTKKMRCRTEPDGRGRAVEIVQSGA